jgi:uncharacterized membrane protein
MAMSASVITVRNAAANLGMMVAQHYAHLHFVILAQLSGHHSKSASPILAERKQHFDSLYSVI